MSAVTRVLSEIEQGDPCAAEQLLPLVYDELRRLAARKLARESPDHTLQATALVHEAYIRLVDVDQVQNWNSRGHFYAAAAEAMRRILVERARSKHSAKRGGRLTRKRLSESAAIVPQPCDDVLALDEAVRDLTQIDPSSAELVKLRVFAGLSVEEAAQALGMSSRTAARRWAYARAWIIDRVGGG